METLSLADNRRSESARFSRSSSTTSPTKIVLRSQTKTVGTSFLRSNLHSTQISGDITVYGRTIRNIPLGRRSKKMFPFS